ncbi:hypothetical protein A9P82_08800 [Arachidicoccus ginsenosidimutans]|uniref:hypothetical protein n=1 Tax=Arachidicoccus sp. BS20 TaxID=1850526 RepID=UPI0007F0B1F5|nr:hypothetical protein [Arachidicoccus sp. BS20]ANI89381.1 hypothetical protein A9P82_08800 [Arachidicoccus sp. BS20]
MLNCTNRENSNTSVNNYNQIDTAQVLQSFLNSISLLNDLLPYRDSILKIVKNDIISFPFIINWLGKRVVYIEANEKVFIPDTVGISKRLRMKEQDTTIAAKSNYRISSFEMLIKKLSLTNDTASISCNFKNTGLVINCLFVKREPGWELDKYSWGWK